MNNGFRVIDKKTGETVTADDISIKRWGNFDYTKHFSYFVISQNMDLLVVAIMGEYGMEWQQLGEDFKVEWL